MESTAPLPGARHVSFIRSAVNSTVTPQPAYGFVWTSVVVLLVPSGVRTVVVSFL